MADERRPVHSADAWPRAWPGARGRVRPAGAVLYEQGDDVHAVHVIERGLVKLTRTSPGGHRMVVALRAPQWVLGAASAILARPHPATAETVTEATIQTIDAAQFMRVSGADPAAGDWVLRMLARECLEQLEHTTSIVLGARQRLLRLLALLAETGGQAAALDGTLRVRVALRHREMAEAIWTSRETVTRLLHDLAREGVARFEEGELVIPARSPIHAVKDRMHVAAGGDPSHTPA